MNGEQLLEQFPREAEQSSSFRTIGLIDLQQANFITFDVVNVMCENYPIISIIYIYIPYLYLLFLLLLLLLFFVVVHLIQNTLIV